jgi:signal transduction histidine kinase
MAPQAAEKQVGLDVEGTETDLEVSGDPEQMEQLVGNLLSNAIKYTDSGGQVDVELARDDGCARLRVSDTGVGIPAEELPRIWDDFFRASNAREVAQHSSGLGLAIVKSIVERYGGTVSLQSELGKGTTVAVVLPVAPRSGPPEPGTEESRR